MWSSFGLSRSLGCVFLVAACLPCVFSMEAQVTDPAWKTFRDLTQDNPTGTAPSPTWGDWCTFSDSTEGYISLANTCPASGAVPAFHMMLSQTQLAALERARKQRFLRSLTAVVERLPQGGVHPMLPQAPAPTPIPMVSAVLLDTTATKSIRNIPLTQSGILSDALPQFMSTHPGSTGIGPFLTGSTIVKTIWVALSQTGPSLTVPLSNGSAGVHNMTIMLQRPVGQPSAPDPTKQCSFTPGTGGSPGLVAVSCFFLVPVDNNNITDLGQHALAHYPLPPSTIHVPYTLALLGFNVMIRNNTGWTWQTFWWDAGTFSNAGTASGFSAYLQGNPYSSSSSIWSHFARDQGPAQGPSHVYNRYLEGFAGGDKTDCLACHQRARFHNVQPPSNQALIHCYFAQATAVMTTLPANCQSPTVPADAGFGTDLVWNLADSNDLMLHKASTTAAHSTPHPIAPLHPAPVAPTLPISMRPGVPRAGGAPLRPCAYGTGPVHPTTRPCRGRTRQHVSSHPVPAPQVVAAHP